MPSTGKSSRPYRDGVKSRRKRFVTENPSANVEQNEVVQPPEKLLPQTEVNNLVGAAKQRGYEKGRKDLMQEMQTQQTQSQPAAQPVPATQAQANFQPQPIAQNPDDIRRIAQEEIARQHQAAMQAYMQSQQNAEGQRIYNELNSKFSDAKAKDPTSVDFQQVLQDFHQNPEILRWANSVDNVADVIKNLQENPGKIGTLASLKNMPENYGVSAIKQISDSLKQNQSAEQSPKAPEPLSQIRPSNVGVGNGNGSENYSAQFKGLY